MVSDPTRTALAAADGYELGYRQLWGNRVEWSLSYWLVDLEGELVWVGDQGVTELGGLTRRHGPEVELKWKLSDYLWVDVETFYSRGHFRGTNDVIARAPRFAASGGLAFQFPQGPGGNVRVRHLGSHPLAEDYRHRSLSQSSFLGSLAGSPDGGEPVRRRCEGSPDLV